MDWNPKQKINGISIQVCLNGYSFKVEDDGAVTESGWRGADTVFTAPEFQRRYRHVEVSLFTPKVALVPRTFFDESTARQSLADTVVIGDGDEVSHASLPEYAAELVYSLSIGEMLSRTISQAVLDFDGRPAEVLPEMYYILKDLQNIDEYNRIMRPTPRDIFILEYLRIAICFWPTCSVRPISLPRNISCSWP